MIDLGVRPATVKLTAEYRALEKWEMLNSLLSTAAAYSAVMGSLVLLLNVTLLSCYALGCHSLRHLIGGIRDRLSGAPIRKQAYDCVSCLNRSHMLFAWCSLIWVAFSDFYVRMCSMGVWTDWRIF